MMRIRKVIVYDFKKKEIKTPYDCPFVENFPDIPAEVNSLDEESFFPHKIQKLDIRRIAFHNGIESNSFEYAFTHEVDDFIGKLIKSKINDFQIQLNINKSEIIRLNKELAYEKLAWYKKLYLKLKGKIK